MINYVKVTLIIIKSESLKYSATVSFFSFGTDVIEKERQ